MYFPLQKKAEENLSIEEQLKRQHKSTTQFRKTMDELGIEMFPASTPQAKRRIERLCETLQSRLVTEFRIHSITTMDQANAFLPIYIKKYNNQFEVAPEVEKSSFIPLSSKTKLDTLLYVKIERSTDNAGVFLSTAVSLW